jgi:Flp pilus assembly protein TadG
MRQKKSFCASEPGQSLLEFAILLPVLLLILLGAVDLGRLYYAQVTITNASREAARFGISDPKNPTGIQARALAEANGAITAANITIECAPYNLSQPYSAGYCASAHAEDRLRVTITYNFTFLTLYMFGFANLGLSSFTTMAIINAPS